MSQGAPEVEALILLGGSFWSLEYYLTGVPGTKVEPGYAGNDAWPKLDERKKPNPDPDFYNLRHTGFSEAVRVRYKSRASLLEMFKRYRTHLTLDQTDTFEEAPERLHRYRRAVLCPTGEIQDVVRPILRKLGFQTVAVERGRRFHLAEKFHHGRWVRDRGIYVPEPEAAPALAEQREKVGQKP